jgi:hypothetical protein
MSEWVPEIIENLILHSCWAWEFWQLVSGPGQRRIPSATLLGTGIFPLNRASRFETLVPVIYCIRKKIYKQLQHIVE